MSKFSDTKIYKKIVKDKVCYFVSPHLDDAIFSAGGLMNTLGSLGINIKVVNIFTKSSEPPYTLSARKFINACGYENATKLFEDRLSEDKKVLTKVGAVQINLGFTDALWRKKKNKSALGMIMPELDYVYPFFRTSIARGKISVLDSKLISNIQKSLKKTINKNYVVLCPSGVGNHTDHIITRDICLTLFPSLILWSDHPYNLHNDISAKLVEKNRLLEYNHTVNVKVKTELMNMYESQTKAIFGKAKTQAPTKEKYFIPNEYI